MGIDIPGPGSYEYSGPNTGTTVSLRGKPRDSKPRDMPGPGYYETKSSINTGRLALDKSPKGLRKLNESPGPGEYELKTIKESPKYKFGTSSRPEMAKRGGEFNYNIPAGFPNAPK